MTKNFSNVFHMPFTGTTLALINTCKAIKQDKKGSYVLTAVSFDELGNVSFIKEYR